MVHSFRSKAVAFSVRSAAEVRDMAAAQCYCFPFPLSDITKSQQHLQPTFLKEKTVSLCVCVVVCGRGGCVCACVRWGKHFGKLLTSEKGSVSLGN